MKLIDAIDLVLQDTSDCPKSPLKCDNCRAKDMVVIELLASKKRERAMWKALSGHCQHCYSRGCGYTNEGKKCQLRTCPLLVKKGGGK